MFWVHAETGTLISPHMSRIQYYMLVHTLFATLCFINVHTYAHQEQCQDAEGVASWFGTVAGVCEIDALVGHFEDGAEIPLKKLSNVDLLQV